MIDYLLNDNWLFNEQGSSEQNNISVPHTVNIEPLYVYKNKQGVFEYEKIFNVDNYYKNQRVIIEFEAVMINCKVYVNDVLVKEHFGGYLPFSIDVTKIVNYDSNNKLFVVVDNRDDKNTPPGKPTNGLDFLYYGGIYRNVHLKYVPEIYLTNSTDECVEWGGVQVETTVNNTNTTATIDIKDNIKSFCNENKRVQIIHTICFKDDIVCQNKQELNIDSNSDIIAYTKIDIQNPILWDTVNPNLYTLTSEIIYDNNKDSRKISFGIRTVSIEHDGFYLNGKKVKLFGFNRGQQFPYLGISVSDEAQRREARMIKQSGINCLRLAHYPQSPAFIDECDKLGIMVIDPVPGWQFLGGKIWQERLKQNLVDLVHRDRNHPSVIIFEVTPNETNWTTKKGDLYLNDLHKFVKSECKNVLTGGDNVGRLNSLTANFDVPYYGKDGRNIISRYLKKDTRLTLKREYGDWCFGGNESTSRTSRGNGEKAMQIQTWNFQFDHNNNYRQGGIIGDLIWEGIDHNRGYFKDAPISMSGIYDVFRLPKLSYQFVRSQAKANAQNEYVIFMQALTWEDKNKIAFYSNCDNLELYCDNNLIEKKSCDNGNDVIFDAKKFKSVNDNYWMTNEDHVKISQKLCPLAKHTISCMFDGGNCKHIDYPPFTFKNLALDNVNSITVKGYSDNKLVCEKQFKRYSKAVKLAIKPSTYGIDLRADDNDFIFVYVEALNENGEVDVKFSSSVKLEVINGTLIGHSEYKAEAGIAPFMIKANKDINSVIINAYSDDLKLENYVIDVASL